MLALGLTIGLFAFWTLLGVAVITALRVPLAPLRQLLLAPVVGVTVTVLPLSLLSRLGLPIGNVAHSFTVVMLIVAGLLVVFSRPSYPWRRYAPFAACLLGALLLSGWPMLEFGFEWLSLCNPDMGNYCLSAVRFSHYGFYDVPAPQELIRGTDYSLYYWFLYVPGMQRSGCEMLLCWLMNVTGLTPHQAFMPLILAFHMVLVSCTGALVYVSRQKYAAAIAACAMLAASALTTFGTLYQLIAQVIGLAILAGCATVLLRHLTPDADDEASPTPVPTPPSSRDAAGKSPFDVNVALARSAWQRRLPEGLLLGLLGTGLVLLYPEVAPILAAAWAIYMARWLLVQWRNRRSAAGGEDDALAAAGPAKSSVARRPLFGLRETLTVGAVALVTILLLLWSRAVIAVVFVVGQTEVGSEGTELQLVYFPFYLLPSGLANFWGFLPLSRTPAEPLASIAIFAAALLLLVALLLCAWMAWRGQPVAMVAGVMLALSLPLFARSASFGLYKLAMFLQPFVLGTLVAGWFALTHRRHWALRVAPLVLLALPGLNVQQEYVKSSRGRGGGVGFGEVPGASHTRVNEEFRRLIDEAVGDPPGVIADSYNTVLAMFQAAYTRRLPAAFPSTNLGITQVQMDWPAEHELPRETIMRPALRLHRRLALEVRTALDDGAFDLHSPGEPGAVNRFQYRGLGPPQPPDPSSLFVAAGPRQTVYNRWHRRRDGQTELNFYALPLRSVRNHLVFVESELGKSYYKNARDISLYQLEPDSMYRGESMAAAGKHFLFQVVNPSPTVRVVLEVTGSFAADGENRLPPAEAIGAGRAKFPLIGRGAARVFSEPLSPQAVGGRSYVMLDMANPPRQFPQRRTGLMGLYGRGVNIDWRHLVGFVRDISVVSDRQYEALTAPESVGKFPGDLQDPRLEFSGAYEDGWLSDHAWFTLAQPWNSRMLKLKGYVPQVADPNFTTEVTVLVDGREVGRRSVGVGTFEVEMPVPGKVGRCRVELRATSFQRLPGLDRRPVSCRLELLGFSDADTPPVRVTRINGQPAYAGADHPLLQPRGIDRDGWVSGRGSLRLAQPPGATELVVRGMVPRVEADAFSTVLNVRVGGRPVGQKALGLGEFELRVPADQPEPGVRALELDLSRTQRLPAPDGREVGFRLDAIGFEAPAGPPTRLREFPRELKNPLFRAKGLYEDGWAAPTASLELTRPAEATELVVKGMVPRLDLGSSADGRAPFKTELTVLLDGEEAAKESLGVGEFDLRVPLSQGGGGGGRCKVELRFSEAQVLPDPDKRQVGARLSLIEIQ